MSGERSVGYALDGETMTAVYRSAQLKGAWRSTSVPCDATPAGIARVAAELGGQIVGWNNASVTLMRPLANTRTVSFPRMSRATLAGVLERDWSRHVIGVRATSHTVAVRR